MIEANIIEKEKLNHQAYEDVMENNDPSLPDNEYYMSCYRSWFAISPYNDYLDNNDFDEF